MLIWKQLLKEIACIQYRETKGKIMTAIVIQMLEPVLAVRY